MEYTYSQIIPNTDTGRTSAEKLNNNFSKIVTMSDEINTSISTINTDIDDLTIRLNTFETLLSNFIKQIDFHEEDIQWNVNQDFGYEYVITNDGYIPLSVFDFYNTCTFITIVFTQTEIKIYSSHRFSGSLYLIKRV